MNEVTEERDLLKQEVGIKNKSLKEQKQEIEKLKKELWEIKKKTECDFNES